MVKVKLSINLFVTSQICGCDSEPGCCAAVSQSEKEIRALAGELKKIAQVGVKITRSGI